MSFPMKFHLMILKNRQQYDKRELSDLVFGLLLLISLLSFRNAQQDFPEKPVPPRLVNDFAGMLSDQEVNALEEQAGCI